MQNFMGAKPCTNWIVSALIILTSGFAQASWTVDLSRRQQDIKRMEREYQRPVRRGPASDRGASDAVSIMPIEQQLNPSVSKGILGGLFQASHPIQEVVILNTETGFVPSRLHLEKEGRYQVRVVNINGENKNVSFILDAFSEHHGTYFGKMKSFEVSPKTEGVFAFHCPETGAQGEIVVTENSTQRVPASQ